MKMKKTYFLIVLFLCGLSVRNVCASASAAAAADDVLKQALRDAAEAGDSQEVARLLALASATEGDLGEEVSETAKGKEEETGEEAAKAVAAPLAWGPWFRSLFLGAVTATLEQELLEKELLRQELIDAARRGKGTEVERLIARGADVRPNYIGDTALMQAAKNGREKIVERLLQVKWINVDAADRSGHTALIEAAYRGNLPIVKRLLAAGADVNAQGGIFEYTALMQAALMGRENIVKELLQVKGINVNATDRDGHTALIRAAEEGNENIVKMLLQAGADTTIKNNRGKTAYDVARTQKIRNMLKKARLWKVQKQLELGRLKGETSPFRMLPREMIGEIMKRVEDAEFPEK